jgi:hypothetical protein
MNALRCARNLTVRELQRATGIPLASLADYLVGRTPVPSHRRAVIAAALGVTVGDLFEDGAW